jgi:hypothetical protein
LQTLNLHSDLVEREEYETAHRIFTKIASRPKA